MKSFSDSLKEVFLMTATANKPTVYLLGTKKKDTPSTPTITKEQMKEMIEDVQKYLKFL